MQKLSCLFHQNFLLNKDLCMKFSAKSQQCFFSKMLDFIDLDEFDLDEFSIELYTFP